MKTYQINKSTDCIDVKQLATATLYYFRITNNSISQINIYTKRR